MLQILSLFICRNGKPQGFPSAGNDRPVLKMAGQKVCFYEEKNSLFLHNSSSSRYDSNHCNKIIDRFVTMLTAIGIMTLLRISLLLSSIVFLMFNTPSSVMTAIA